MLCTTAIAIGFALLFVIANLHTNLWFQLCYTFFFERQVYAAYRRVKREGCVYYASYEEWMDSPTCGTGNEVVDLGGLVGVYTESKLVLTDYFGKMVNDLIEESKCHVQGNN